MAATDSTAKPLIPPALLAPFIGLQGSWDVIKLDLRAGTITLVWCDDFDGRPEPAIRSSVLLRPDGSHKRARPFRDPCIYHHKWLMVAPDYQGFDVEESKARSRAWIR